MVRILPINRWAQNGPSRLHLATPPIPSSFAVFQFFRILAVLVAARVENLKFCGPEPHFLTRRLATGRRSPGPASTVSQSQSPAEDHFQPVRYPSLPASKYLTPGRRKKIDAGSCLPPPEDSDRRIKVPANSQRPVTAQCLTRGRKLNPLKTLW